jgi:hypothetical protein
MDERDPSPIGAIFIWIGIFGLALGATLATQKRFGEPLPLLVGLTIIALGGAVGSTAGRPTIGLFVGVIVALPFLISA